LRVTGGRTRNRSRNGCAYIPAGELHRAGGDHRAAFARYWEMFQPLTRAKQEAALRFAVDFAPKSKFRLWLRNRILIL
jgi:hypothetical protein